MGLLDPVISCTETAGGARTLSFELMLEELVRVGVCCCRWTGKS